MKDTVVVTSYEMIRMDTNFFTHHSWFYLIVDEGHRLKNNESQLMQCLFTFSHSPETSRLILTGTPLQVVTLNTFKIEQPEGVVVPFKLPSS